KGDAYAWCKGLVCKIGIEQEEDSCVTPDGTVWAKRSGLVQEIGVLAREDTHHDLDGNAYRWCGDAVNYIRIQQEGDVNVTSDRRIWQRTNG
ncbi:MAG TPA: hypothetical protein PKH07_20825, partial [bacterium]|nr:hypothetical protein [bacterium]